MDLQLKITDVDRVSEAAVNLSQLASKRKYIVGQCDIARQQYVGRTIEVNRHVTIQSPKRRCLQVGSINTDGNPLAGE